MGTRFSRIAILVVFALGGAALIQSGFPQGGVSAEILPSPSPVGVPGGGSSADAGSDTGADAEPSPSSIPIVTVVSVDDLEGLKVAVYNGTTATGLAADTMTRLQDRFGMVNAQTGNSEMAFPITEIRYAAGYEEHALLLAREFFGALAGAITIEPLDPALAELYGVVLLITLGADWAAEA